jgi:predicted deacylase
MKTFERIVDADSAPLTFHEFGEGLRALFVSGGIHGDEDAAVEIADALLERLRGLEASGRMTGTVTVLSKANPPALARGLRCAPSDGLDLNRVFPGGPASPTERTAAEIWKVATSHERVVDLHNCPAGSITFALALHRDFPCARAAAEALSLPVTVQSSGKRGQLFVEATHTGIPAAIIEAPNRRGRGRGAVQDLVLSALEQALARWGILPAAQQARKPTRFFGRLERVRSPRPGRFLAETGIVGREVKAGEALGTLDGAAIPSPLDGLVVFAQSRTVSSPGQSVARVARSIGL